MENSATGRSIDEKGQVKSIQQLLADLEQLSLLDLTEGILQTKASFSAKVQELKEIAKL